ncbi:hypothetical protein [Marinigracilibium pacificum]|uniref:Uncharacterized protein n=1 Tax=Marinigracilibium pacificum TaxID=2729599 RepID=A0A848J1A9_9BACT|nr:hypothetical protein [Marinigracilibium pacificum]NMM50347.1 hypothetical protein [Marinigracilibium pacificum]
MNKTYGIFAINNDGSLNQVFMNEEFINEKQAEFHLSFNRDVYLNINAFVIVKVLV